MKGIGKLLAAVALCEGVGIVSSVFTIPAITTWYVTLNKPFFSPPNGVFGPVWTTLYALMGISLYLIWQKGAAKKKVRAAIGIFMLQLVLNFLWSLLFFGMHSPALGLVDIVLLFITIAATIQKFYPLSRTAAYLLIPYLLWVAIATVLNTSILLLN